MVRTVRWESAATGIALVLACGCNARALAPTVDAGRDASSVSTPTTAMGDASAGAGGEGGLTSPGAGASLGAAGAGGSATGGTMASTAVEAPLCPPVDEVGPGSSAQMPAPPPASAVGISCRALPPAFIFPPPDAAAAGQFTRCASFDVGAAKSVAVSPDGRSVALVTEDGLARLIPRSSWSKCSRCSRRLTP